MSYYDLDSDSKIQQDIWWRYEEVDEYLHRRGKGGMDIMEHLLGYVVFGRERSCATWEELRANVAQVAYAFGGDELRRRYLDETEEHRWVERLDDRRKARIIQLSKRELWNSPEEIAADMCDGTFPRTVELFLQSLADEAR